MSQQELLEYRNQILKIRNQMDKFSKELEDLGETEDDKVYLGNSFFEVYSGCCNIANYIEDKVIDLENDEKER